MTNETHLEIDSFTKGGGNETCDGCGKRYKIGEKILVNNLGNIGSYHDINYDDDRYSTLCKGCVRWAFLKLFKDAFRKLFVGVKN